MLARRRRKKIRGRASWLSLQAVWKDLVRTRCSPRKVLRWSPMSTSENTSACLEAFSRSKIQKKPSLRTKTWLGSSRLLRACWVRNLRRILTNSRVHLTALTRSRTTCLIFNSKPGQPKSVLWISRRSRCARCSKSTPCKEGSLLRLEPGKKLKNFTF